MTQYLIKYIKETGETRYVDPTVDVLAMRSVRLGGVLFDESNIVTVSGVNSLTAALASVSGAADAEIARLDATLMSVSGELQTEMTLVSGALHAETMSVSGASSLRDDQQDLRLQSVSGSLQNQINAIVADHAREQLFIVSGVGQRDYTVSAFSFNADNSIPDIKITRNGIGQRISPAGVSSVGAWHKTGTNAFVLHYDPAIDDEIMVRDERTGGGVGGATDLENITVNPQPDVNGARSLGWPKAWAAVYLADMVSGGIYRAEVSGGVFQVVQVA